MAYPTAPAPSPSRGLSPLSAASLCFALALLMHLPWIGITHLAGTEGHRVLAARGMIENHWWLVATLYGKPFMTKPPLHYWMIAWAQLLAGRGNLFVWRLPSALTGALLCGAACLFGCRWFGRTAGLISGMCAVGMIAWWGQCQTADIDATNTFFTGVAAFGGIELLFATPIAGSHQNPQKPRWIWIIGTGLALAGMLMTKGPAGLPSIVGVWLTAGVVAWLERREGELSRLSFWLPWVIGLILFGWYSAAARHSVVVHGMPLDKRGLEEGLHRMYPGSVKQLGQSLFSFLPQVIAFSLPMSASLLFLRDPDVRVMLSGRAVRIAAALTLSVLASWLVCLASGMTNPRYAYITYAPLCPLAGAMAVAAAQSRQSKILRMAIVMTAIALAAATAGLAWACRKGPVGVSIGIGACVSIAGGVVVSMIRGMRMHAVPLDPRHEGAKCARGLTPFIPRAVPVIASTELLNASAIDASSVLPYADPDVPTSNPWTPAVIRWNAAWGLVVLMLLASIPFGMQRHLAREKESGFVQAALVQAVTGEPATVAAGETILWRPEIFYYTHGIEPEFHPYSCLPEVVKPGRWVMLDEGEHRKWIHRPGVLLERERLLCRGSNGIDYYLGWYAGYTP